MTEIQQNRYDRLIRRVTNVVGGGSQVNDTLNELFPVIDVENQPIELLALSRYNVAMAASVFNPLAANNNLHQLFNPVGSGLLIVLTTLLVRSSLAQLMHLALTNAPLTTDIGNVVRRDTREGVAARSAGQNRSVQQVGGIAAHGLIQVVAQVTFKLDDQNGLFVLFPGDGITVATSTVNSATNATWFWRERAFEPAEVNF